MASVSGERNGESGLVLTVLGCGTMGTAILSGIFSSSSSPPQTSTSTSSTTKPPPSMRLPSRYIACVNRPESAQRVRAQLANKDVDLTVLTNDNVSGVKQADIILLGCKPYHYRDVLAAEGMREALAGKFLISILAGVRAAQIEEHLYDPMKPEAETNDRCRIINVLPNTAAAVRESMTYVANATPPLPSEQIDLVNWIFGGIGQVVHLPPHLFDAATALCGSGPAFMAVVLEAMADGAVAMGIPRAEAQQMAAQVMRGTAMMVLNGEHPAVVKDKVCSPGGCSIAGVLRLEEGGVRGTISRALRDATEVASGLGKPK